MCATDDANRRLDAFAGRAEDHVARAREAIRDRILRALENRPYAGVIAALAIGDERAIPSAQWLLFNRTGIGHLISISGLHVTFFATLIGALVFWAWKRSHALTLRLPARKAAAIAGVVAAFGYVLLAGFAVPAQRTLYMLTVAAIGLWLARPGTASVVWLWALAVVLAYDPWASLTPGFWLSFGAVGLLLYTGVGRIGPTATWRAAVRAQAAITLGLIPLMLVLFQQVSIVSPLANAVAIPVVTFIVVPLTLASIALPWDGLLVIAHQVFAWLALLLEILSGLPAAVWQQHAPPLWTALAGAIGVLWLLAPRGVPARMLGLAWLAPLFVVVPPPPAPGAFRVTVLDVGQGLAVLVQTHAHALLYDTGPRYNDTADAGNRIIAPMLRATGIRALDALVVSHQDSDHSGGALSLLQTVPVGWLVSSLPEQNAIVGAQRARGASARRCLAGARWTWDGVEFATLYPFDSTYLEPRIKTNDLSCVLRVSGAGGSVLLTGDIEARAESAMLARDAAAAALRPADRAASRQPDVVDTRIHRRRASGGRRVHARLSQSLRTPAARSRRTLRGRRHSQLSHRLRRGADLYLWRRRIVDAESRTRARTAILAGSSGACGADAAGVTSMAKSGPGSDQRSARFQEATRSSGSAAVVGPAVPHDDDVAGVDRGIFVAGSRGVGAPATQTVADAVGRALDDIAGGRDLVAADRRLHDQSPAAPRAG